MVTIFDKPQLLSQYISVIRIHQYTRVYCSFSKLFAVVFHEGNYLIDVSYNLHNLEITTSALNRFF